MRKLISLVFVLAMLVMVSVPAMADSARVTGTGPKLVVTGQDSVITAIFSVTVSGTAVINIQGKAQTYTADVTPTLEFTSEIGATDLKNKWLDLGSGQSYHALENNPGRQWNNGIESHVAKFTGFECANGIVVDFKNTTGTVYVVYEKKAVKQDDVNYINAE